MQDNKQTTSTHLMNLRPLERTEKNLKIAHVAMSRSTDLMAFACSKAGISGHEEKLIKNGWRIYPVGKNG